MWVSASLRNGTPHRTLNGAICSFARLVIRTFGVGAHLGRCARGEEQNRWSLHILDAMVPRVLRRVVDRTGEVLAGRYRIVRLIEVGEISTLYVAETGDFGRTVTVELLHDDLVDQEAGRRFRAAGLAAAAIEHPHVVLFLDLIAERGKAPFVVWEPLQGETLARVLERFGRIMPERAARIAIQALSALAAAHASGIVHGAIKPANIFLARLVAVVGDVAKVREFRSAKARRERSATSTTTGRLAITPPRDRFLTAPEVLRGAEADARSDVYAVAATIYLAVSGLRDAELAGDLAPLDALGIDVPSDFSAIVARGLSADPADRYPTAAQMADAFVQWLGPEPDESERTPEGIAADRRATTIQIRARPRRPWAAPLSAGASLALGSAVWLGAHRAPLAAPSAAAPVAPVVAESSSANPDAMAAYRAGIDAIRRAAGGAARRHFDRAIELDPSFAAAHLRKVLATPTVGDGERENVRRATQLRATLSEHDRALLHAIEPWVGVPQDVHEVERRLVELAAVHEDAEYHYQLCRFRVLDGSYVRAIDACREARELDQGFAGAYWLEGQAALFAGDTTAGTGAIDMCLRLSAGATSCLNDMLQLQSNSGSCGPALETARRLVAIEPENAAALLERAVAASGAGEPVALIHDELDRALTLFPAGEAPRERAAAFARFSILQGDFMAAGVELDAWEHAIANAHDERAHVRPFVERAWLARETGTESDLVEEARGLLARRAAWSPSADQDALVAATVVLYRAHEVSRRELDAVRANEDVPDGWRRWVDAFASAIVNRADADLALAAMPRASVPPERSRDARDDESIGAAYLAADRVDEAMPYLRRAARSCRAARFPLQQTWASLELAQALERSDSRGACDAYHVVVSRWGSASSSRSAAIARTRRAVLGCR